MFYIGKKDNKLSKSKYDRKFSQQSFQNIYEKKLFFEQSNHN